MLYLSDKILVRYSMPSGSAYSNYSVYAMDARYSYSTTPIFTGRVFRTDNSQTLYLNDIIKNYMYNPCCFVPRYDGDVAYAPDPLMEGARMVSKFKVIFAYGETRETDWVLPYYKDANLPIGPMKANGFNPESEGTGVQPTAYYPLAERTSLLPRIPRISVDDSKFWTAIFAIPNNVACYESQVDGDSVFVYYDGEEEEQYWDDCRNMWGTKLFGASIHELTQGSGLWIKQYDNPEDPLSHDPISIKVADVDSCPAPYYLIWMDRTGAYQCQPFTKRVDFTESISTVNVTDMQGDERPYEKDVAPQWVLHTDWMSDDDHKAYESILTSPYIYLYDTENDLGWYVNCTDSSWTDKVYKNQKKMFYLTINLKAIGKQELVY